MEKLTARRVAADGFLFLIISKKDINFSFAAHSENCLDSLEKSLFMLSASVLCLYVWVNVHVTKLKEVMPTVKEIKNKLQYASICQLGDPRDYIINLHI